MYPNKLHIELRTNSWVDLSPKNALDFSPELGTDSWEQPLLNLCGVEWKIGHWWKARGLYAGKNTQQLLNSKLFAFIKQAIKPFCISETLSRMRRSVVDL